MCVLFIILSPFFVLSPQSKLRGARREVRRARELAMAPDAREGVAVRKPKEDYH